MLIDAINTALEDREIPLSGIGGGIAANIFIGGMVDGTMTGEPLTNFPVNGALIGSQMRRLVDAGF